MHSISTIYTAAVGLYAADTPQAIVDPPPYEYPPVGRHPTVFFTAVLHEFSNSNGLLPEEQVRFDSSLFYRSGLGWLLLLQQAPSEASTYASVAAAAGHKWALIFAAGPRLGVHCRLYAVPAASDASVDCSGLATLCKHPQACAVHCSCRLHSQQQSMLSWHLLLAQ